MSCDQIFIIPILLDNSRPQHEILQDIHWVELFDSYEQGFERIVQVLSTRSKRPVDRAESHTENERAQSSRQIQESTPGESEQEYRRAVSETRMGNRDGFHNKLLNVRFSFTALLAVVGVVAFSYLIIQVITQLNATSSQFEKSVLEKKRDVLAVRGDWADMDRIGNSAREAVARAAAPLGESLLRIDDSNLRIGYQIVKYQFAAYAFMMAADVEPDRKISLALCDRSIEQGFKTLRLIRDALDSESNSEYNNRTARWIREDRQQDRTNFLLVFAFAVKYQKGDQTSLGQARSRLELVSTQYKQDMEYTKHRTLQAILPEANRE